MAVGIYYVVREQTFIQLNNVNNSAVIKLVKRVLLGDFKKRKMTYTRTSEFEYNFINNNKKKYKKYGNS